MIKKWLLFFILSIFAPRFFVVSKRMEVKMESQNNKGLKTINKVKLASGSALIQKRVWWLFE